MKMKITLSEQEITRHIISGMKHNGNIPHDASVDVKFVTTHDDEIGVVVEFESK